MRTCASISHPSDQVVCHLCRGIYPIYQVVCHPCRYISQVVCHLCHSLREGLKSHEVAISSQCAAAIEHLASFHHRQMTGEYLAGWRSHLAHGDRI